MKKAITALCLAGALTCAAHAFAQGCPDEPDGRKAGIPYARLFTSSISKPGDLAFDGESLWITDRVGGFLWALDPETGATKGKLISPGPHPTGLAFDGKFLWVADQVEQRLYAIDVEDELVVKEVLSAPNPLGMAFDGEHLWLADGKQIHQVSTEDGTTIKSFSAPTWDQEGRGGEQLGLAFEKGYLWVSDRQSDEIYRVHVDTGFVVDVLAAPSAFPAGLTFYEDALLIADRHTPGVDKLIPSAIPRITQSCPKKEELVLRRRVTNYGPSDLATTQIAVALPHSTPNQALEGEPRYSTPPVRYVEDEWGQRFALFEGQDLPPGQSLEVEARFRATLFEARYHIDPAQVGSRRDIPKKIRNLYLADASKFDIDGPIIRKHLEEALDGEKNLYFMARKIAKYIQDRMHYELDDFWNVAPTVIERGSGSCSEYSFVFIAMCRAAGIPARYVGAFVVRGDDASTDAVFHRWPEIYLPNYGWIPADAQAGDKPEPEKQAEAMSSLPPRFLITTWGGGGSSVIGWDYNSTARWTCKGRCKVEDIHLGDWYPAAEAAASKKP